MSGCNEWCFDGFHLKSACGTVKETSLTISVPAASQLLIAAHQSIKTVSCMSARKVLTLSPRLLKQHFFLQTQKAILQVAQSAAKRDHAHSTLHRCRGPKKRQACKLFNNTFLSKDKNSSVVAETAEDTNDESLFTVLQQSGSV